MLLDQIDYNEAKAWIRLVSLNWKQWADSRRPWWTKLKETNSAGSVSFFNESKVFQLSKSCHLSIPERKTLQYIFNKTISQWIKFQEESITIQVNILPNRKFH